MSNPRIQLRHDTAANWSIANPVLLDGEVGIEKGSSETVNLTIEDSSYCSIANNILTIPSLPSDTSSFSSDILIHTPEPLTHNESGSQYFDMKIRCKVALSHPDYVTFFRQYVKENNSEFDFIFRLEISSSANQLQFFYNNWANSVMCSIPSDYTDKFYTYRAYREYPNQAPGIEVIDDEGTVLYSALGQHQMNLITPSSLTGCYTTIASAKGESFVGDIDLTKTFIHFGSQEQWDAVTGNTPAKLKIGDGETAWNDLPYVI